MNLNPERKDQPDFVKLLLFPASLVINDSHSLENLKAQRYQDTLFLTCWLTQEGNNILFTCLLPIHKANLLGSLISAQKIE